MKPRNLLVVLALGIAAFGCRKSAEAERDEAARAAAEAEKTAIEEGKKASDRVNKKTFEAMQEQNDFFAAVRREQLDLRGQVQDELDDIDKKLMDYRVEHGRDGQFVIPGDAKDRTKIDDLLKRRAVLKADADAIENATPDTWARVKEQVDKDLGARARGKI
jgi:hypothetical protein